MSGSVKLNLPAGGSKTISAPDSASDETITLPAGTKTLVDTGTTDALDTRINAVGGRKNLIINGDMVVNQRGGTATINGTGVTYNIDRWLGRGVSSAGVFTLVQSASSCPDFRKALTATVTTADSSIASGSSYRIQHLIEAQNMMHLNWGNSNAKSITLSFWVLSTGPTGTFGGSIANGDYNRFNPFSYSISAANTYEKKTITISGDTSGTWATDNTLGMRVNFSLGAGSSKVGTAGTWTSSSYEGVTGQTNFIATNGAALYITGVQLELGSVATDFEHRSYGEELALCQRYYFQSGYNGGTPYGGGSLCFVAFNASECGGTNLFPVTMRASPTVNIKDGAGNVGGIHRAGIGNITSGVIPTWTGNADNNTKGIGALYKLNAWATGNVLIGGFQADAEL